MDEFLSNAWNRTGGPERARGELFATTHWTVVLTAQNDDVASAEALEKLCAAYWYPLYAYIRRRGNGPENAQDLTQEFFARLLEKRWLDGVEKNGSRFRSFLISAVKAFLANQHDRATAAKRGGREAVLPIDSLEAERRYLQEPATDETPERILDRRWALTILERATMRLKEESAGAGKAATFEALSPFLSRNPEAGEYAAVAANLGVSAGSLGVMVHRLRQQYRQCVIAEIAETLADPSQAEAEMGELLSAMG